MEKVIDENSIEYSIQDQLGAGGQGAVYTIKGRPNIVLKAMIDENEKIVADPIEYKKYKANVRRVLAVGEFDYTAVPFAMLKEPYCGYLMRLMTGLASLDRLLLPYVHENQNKKRIEKSPFFNEKKNSRLAKSDDEIVFAYLSSGGLKKRLKCLAKLAKIMAKFQDSGVVYCDLSPNNIYVSRNFDDFEVWLIDMDNLNYEKDVKYGMGTPKYMAPEVVNGSPNTIKSDEYSFALIAFQLLTYAYPFNGSMIDEFDDWESDDWDSDDDEDKFELSVAKGEIPWIYEKADDRNRSNSGFDASLLLTDELMNLFERSFNENGRLNPSSRPNMWEWYDALLNASESLVKIIPSYSDEFREKIIHIGEFNSYCCNINIFNDNKPIPRIKVIIEYLNKVIDDEGNKAYIPSTDRIIYWDNRVNLSRYSLSNEDIMLLHGEDYIASFVTINLVENINMKKYYSVSCDDEEYKIIALENGSKVSEIESLINTTLYVYKNKKVIKRIYFKREEF